MGIFVVKLRCDEKTFEEIVGVKYRVIFGLVEVVFDERFRKVLKDCTKLFYSYVKFIVVDECYIVEIW